MGPDLTPVFTLVALLPSARSHTALVTLINDEQPMEAHVPVSAPTNQRLRTTHSIDVDAERQAIPYGSGSQTLFPGDPKVRPLSKSRPHDMFSRLHATPILENFEKSVLNSVEQKKENNFIIYTSHSNSLITRTTIKPPTA